MQEYNQAMVDIETLGVRPDGRVIVLSIGAVAFNLQDWDEYNGIVNNQKRIFHVKLDIHEQAGKGLSIDTSTFEWWMSQNKAAQAALELEKERKSVAQALHKFRRWWEQAGGGHQRLKSWGNGPNFDQKVLSVLYNEFEMELPWRYNQERDLRTLRQLAGQPTWESMNIQRGVEHDALEDAVYQVLCAQYYYQGLFG